MVELLGWAEPNTILLDAWLEERGLKKGDMWQAPHSILGPYCVADADATWQLWELVLKPAMEDFPVLSSLFHESYPRYTELLCRNTLRGSSAACFTSGAHVLSVCGPVRRRRCSCQLPEAKSVGVAFWVAARSGVRSRVRSREAVSDASNGVSPKAVLRRGVASSCRGGEVISCSFDACHLRFLPRLRCGHATAAPHRAEDTSVRCVGGRTTKSARASYNLPTCGLRKRRSPREHPCQSRGRPVAVASRRGRAELKLPVRARVALARRRRATRTSRLRVVVPLRAVLRCRRRWALPASLADRARAAAEAEQAPRGI
jgi:hypothetical protein